MAIKLLYLKNFSLKLFLLCIIFLTSISTYSQSTNKRVSISNPTKNVINKLDEAGIDLNCGVQFDGNNNMILELVPEELSRLDNKQVSYTILIEDLSKYYKERSEEFLPIAKKELEELKKKSRENKEKSKEETSKSLSFNSVTVDNIIQYDGCEEIDWSANVPQNFELGSMAGCLTYSEVLAQLALMQSEYPSLITVITDASPGTKTHGNSYNSQGQDTWVGQPIYYVKISDNPNIDEPEPEALYTGMTHSREVNSMMNLMYFMWYLLENYDTDSGVKNLIDNRELYFIPVVNPDGLMWNEQQVPSGGGLQRKNLNPAANLGDNELRGIDLNRNYNYFWGPTYAGSSGTTSNNTYRGTSGFSEPETQIIRNFILGKDIKTAILHHASTNDLLHGYAGDPFAGPSGREDEFAKLCHDMSRYNRYIYGTVPDILTLGNGGTIDWMLGGLADNNGETGSGKEILAITPENGSWQDSTEGFWPTATKIYEVAQRAMRLNFVNGYFAGKFAQLHDFTPTDINTPTGDLDFAIEFTGQTLGDFTIEVTPVSGNITFGSAVTEMGMTKLEQRNVSIGYTLSGTPSANDLIEYQVTLSNEDYIIYQANVVKYYQPTVVFQDDPDNDGTSNWTMSGDGGTSSWAVTNGTNSEGYLGSVGITHAPTGSYGNDQNRIITLNPTFNFTTSEVALVQFNAKWALERNFDYVQLQGRVNGGTWSNLCGKYSKPGSDYGGNRYSSGTSSSNTNPVKDFADQNNQPSGEMVYEGHGMDKWVMEEILISFNNNSQLYNQNNVEFRFVFDSDSNNRPDGYDANFDPFDGFTFDNFRVITLNSNIEQTIKFDPLADKTTASPSFSVSAAASSGLPVSFSIVSGPATIAGNTITLDGVVGTVVVEASQAGNANYNAATSVTQSFEVTPIVCTGNATITTVDYPFSDNFQTGFGNWVQASGDDGDWTLKSGGTSTNSTGPDNDADDNNSGFYMYTEASNGGGIGSNATTNLESPCYELSGMIDADFSFDYHMYGSNMGQLFLELSEDNGATWTDITTSPLSGSIHGASNAAWSTMNVELIAYIGKTIKLRFRGVTGGGQKSDMAIDNISMITVEEVLNTEEVEFDDFQVYPNPFNDNLKIRLPYSLTYKKLKVSIVDLQGRILREKILTNDTQEINIDNLKGISNSVYFISIEIDGNVRVIKKLIKI